MALPSHKNSLIFVDLHDKIVIFGCQKICIDFIDYLRRNKKIYSVPIVFTSERKSDNKLPYKSIVNYCKKKNFKNSEKS